MAQPEVSAVIFRGIDQFSGIAKKVASSGLRVNSALRKMAAGAKVMASAIAAAGRGLRNFALAGTAAAVAFGYMYKRVAGGIDKIHKLSQSTGVAAERLQGLQLAANEAGISNQELNKSILTFNGRIGEASEGMKSYLQNFDKLGISIRDGNGNLKTTDVLLSEVATQFNTIASTSEKAAIAQDLFGRTGKQILPLLKNGAEGLAKYQKEAEALGYVLGTRTVNNVAAANDAMTRVGFVISGVTKRIVGALAPAIQVASDAITDFVKTKVNWETFDKSVRGVISRILNSIADAVDALFSFGRSASSAFKKVKSELKFFYELAKTAAEAVGKVFDIPINTSDIDSANKKIGEYNDKLKSLRAQRDKLNEDSRLLPSIKEQIKQITELRDKYATIVSKHYEENRLLKDKEDKTNNISAAIRKAAAAVAETAPLQEEAIDNTNKKLERQKELYESIGESISKKYKEATENAASASEQIADSMLTTFDNLSKGIGDSVADSIVEQKSLAEGLKSAFKAAAKSIISDLIKIGIQQAVMSAATNAAQVKSTATQVASMGVIGAAAATPAALVSLATSGTNAAGAAAGISSTVALSNSLAFAKVPGFASGGEFNVGGRGGTDNNPCDVQSKRE